MDVQPKIVGFFYCVLLIKFAFKRKNEEKEKKGNLLENREKEKCCKKGKVGNRGKFVKSENIFTYQKEGYFLED